MTMDLHADQIQGFFDIPVDHLKSEAIYMSYLKNTDMSNTIFASPDVGGVKRARAYAKHFKRELVICDKYRVKANEIAGMAVIGDVSGADVILVDDLVDTAGTLCKAADALIEKGARSVKAICTHPVCDTIPIQPGCDKIKVMTAARLFAKAIKHTHEHKSIEALFTED
jgi:ribose-phosphate pyrophosphokinase